jgi:hypothetical protein
MLTALANHQVLATTCHQTGSDAGGDRTVEENHIGNLSATLVR